MALKKKKKKKEFADNFKATLILGCAVLLIGGIFYFNSSFETERKQTADNFCRQGFVPEITAVIIDHTDSFTPVQKEALRKQFKDISSSVTKGGLLEIYSVADVRKEVLKSEFSYCNPGDENDLKNKLTRRESTVRENYEEKFVEGMNGALDSTFVEGGAAQSPIMESIQSVLVTAFAGADRENSKKRLVIISDLLEHTPDLSFFHGVPEFSDYKNTPHWQLMRADMDGVEVELYFVRRTSTAAIPERKIINFWTSYFQSQGANVLGLKHI